MGKWLLKRMNRIIVDWYECACHNPTILRLQLLGLPLIFQATAENITSFFDELRN